MRHYLLIAVSCLLLAFTALSGCGQKGPLTLPTDDTAKEKTTSETPTEPANDTREDDERENQ